MSKKKPIEYYLTRGKELSPSIKKRLFTEGILDEKICSKCGLLSMWEGETLVHEIDHIDGNAKNNLKENLRVLCLHCHSQTDSYRSRNKVVKFSKGVIAFPEYQLKFEIKNIRLKGCVARKIRELKKKGLV